MPLQLSVLGQIRTDHAVGPASRRGLLDGARVMPNTVLRTVSRLATLDERRLPPAAVALRSASA
jgi:hypothetical protein